MGFTLKIKAGPSTWLELEGSKKSILPPFGLKPDLNGVDTVAAPGPPDPPFYAPRILTPGGPVLCPVCVEVATLQVVAPPPPRDLLSPSPLGEIGYGMQLCLLGAGS